MWAGVKSHCLEPLCMLCSLLICWSHRAGCCCVLPCFCCGCWSAMHTYAFVGSNNRFACIDAGPPILLWSLCAAWLLHAMRGAACYATTGLTLTAHVAEPSHCAQGRRSAHKICHPDNFAKALAAGCVVLHVGVVCWCCSFCSWDAHYVSRLYAAFSDAGNTLLLSYIFQRSHNDRQTG
jgi:hypothetical protein